MWYIRCDTPNTPSSDQGIECLPHLHPMNPYQQSGEWLTWKVRRKNWVVIQKGPGEISGAPARLLFLTQVLVIQLGSFFDNWSSYTLMACAFSFVHVILLLKHLFKEYGLCRVSLKKTAIVLNSLSALKHWNLCLDQFIPNERMTDSMGWGWHLEEDFFSWSHASVIFDTRGAEPNGSIFKSGMFNQASFKIKIFFFFLLFKLDGPWKTQEGSIS